jgi:hypothetical protein
VKIQGVALHRSHLAKLTPLIALQAALINVRAEFALQPALRISVLHWVGLTAINAAKLAAARFLHEHKPHGVMARRTDLWIGLDLRHDAALAQARAQNSQSPVDIEKGR